MVPLLSSGEAELLMLLPVILCSVHMSFSTCAYYLQVAYIVWYLFSLPSAPPEERMQWKEVGLLGVLCVFLQVQSAAT